MHRVWMGIVAAWAVASLHVACGAPQAAEEDDADTIDGVVQAVTACQRGQECCPVPQNAIPLTPQADRFTTTLQDRCIEALGGNDSVTARSSGSIVLGGEGSDTITAGVKAVVRGGAGHDTIRADDNSIVYGGAGNDTIMAANGNNFIAPGSGNDVVAGGTGNDTVAIFDRCELSPGGKTIDGSSGFNTLITPVPLSQLPSFGVNVANFQAIVVDADACKSDCGAQADCEAKQCSSTFKAHPYIEATPSGDLRFSLKVPSARKAVKLYVRQNGTQLTPRDITTGGVANADGSHIYSSLIDRGLFRHGDQILVRFESTATNGARSFAPGPEEVVWSPLFTYSRLVEAVSLSKAEVCANEPVTVTVTANGAIPGASSEVSIQGVSGAQRTLQFPGLPGERQVAVTVKSDCLVQDEIKTLIVVACDQTTFVGIGASSVLGNPSAVDFEVTEASELGDEGVRYVWDFGDGSGEVVGYRAMRHAYAAPTAADGVLRNFEVSVRVDRHDVAVARGSRTLSLVNDYAEDKAHGVIKPLVSPTGSLSPRRAGGFSGTVELTNLESDALTLTKRWITPIACESGVAVPEVEESDVSERVEPSATLSIPVDVPASLVSDAVCGFAVRYVGSSWSYRVEATRIFEVRAPTANAVMSNPVKAAAVTYAIDHNLVANPYDVSDDELYQLARQGRIPFTESDIDDGALSGTNSAPPPLVVADDTTPPADLGKECDPSAVPPHPALSCQLTRYSDGNFAMKKYKAKILNAKMGDAVLSQGCSAVAGILRHVEPAQRYEHVGIMTRDYDKIRHAVFSEAYVQRFPSDPDHTFCYHVNEAWIAQGSGGRRIKVVCDAVDAGNPAITGSMTEVCDALDLAEKANNVAIDDLNKKITAATTDAEKEPLRAQLAELQAKQTFKWDNNNGHSCNLLPHSPVDDTRLFKICKAASECGPSANSPTDGFDERAMRYAWPGTIDQCVQEAFVDGRVEAPDLSYPQIVAFKAHPSSCGDSTQALAYPMVLRPTPEMEVATRPRLQAAATLSLSLHGHYRLYGYSKGDIVNDPSFAPTENALWPKTTTTHKTPYVCSTFVWKALTDAGFLLGHNDPSIASEPAGMFFYTEAERKSAANYIYAFIKNQALTENWLGWFVDAENDIASQFANCFAHDLCTPGNGWFDDETGANSEKWKHPKDGITVSPDDILKWSPAAEGGPYGDSERLMYRSGGSRPVSSWQAAEGTGSVTGRVLQGTSPAAGVKVTVQGISFVTGANGAFAFGPLAAGWHDVTIETVINGRPEEQHRQAEIKAGETTHVEFTIEVPRQVTIAGVVEITDGENGPNQIKSFLTSQVLHVGPDELTDAESWDDNCVGDEVHVLFEHSAEWLTGPGWVPGTVRVRVHAHMFEGIGCRSEQGEETDTREVVLPPGTEETITLGTTNDDFSFFPDEMSARFLIVNGEQFFGAEPEIPFRVHGSMHVLDADFFGGDDSDDKAFDYPEAGHSLAVSPGRRAMAIPRVSLRVDDEVTGWFQTMAVLRANNSDIQLFTVQGVDEDGEEDAMKNWVDNINHGTTTTFAARDRRATADETYAQTGFTIVYPRP